VPSHGTYFLGRYRIIDEIGLGGMASVHLARVDGIGGFQRWFAVKRIHAHLVEDETFVNMFLDEANIAARIQHPNVATVFELGKHDDTYWIAMEYLHGEPLREVMRRTEEMGTTMPPEIACRVIAEAADGLHAAHELQGKNGEKLNLIHRDVTPHNLFVTYDGTTKVVDFGIAKFQDRMSSTQAGTLKGKLAYMSPEQVQGEAIDRRTDIFALGVVLWELTTGQRLFRMDSDLDTLAKVQECNIPPPSSMIRGYPLDLEKILMQALAKKRDDRFPTAREFSRALQSLLTRRGLFISNDEVASYMGSIFADRIVKREEHLRWASAVSDAAAAAGSHAPPAAAAPAAAARPAAPAAPPPAPPAAPPPRAAPPPARPTPGPPPAKAPAAAPRPAAGASPPRPAAGAPARPQPISQGPVSVTGLQVDQTVERPPAIPGAAVPPRGSAAPLQRGGASYPLPQPARGTPAPPVVDDDDDDRTVQATAAQQALAQAAYDDDDDDGDATIVSRTAPSDLEPPSIGPPIAPPIIPAAGAPAARKPAPAPPPYAAAPPPAPPPPAPSAPRLAGGRTLGMGSPAPLRQQPTVQNRIPQISPLPGGPIAVPPGYNISDPSLPNRPTMPPQGGAMPPPPQAAQPWGPPAAPQYGPPPQPQQYGGPAGPGMMGMPGMGPPGGEPFGQRQPFPQQQSFGQGQPGAPQLGPPIDYGQNGGYAPPMNYAPQYGAPNAFAATASPDATVPPGQPIVIKPKRVPAWAVALASGIIALMLAGAVSVVYVFFLRGPAPAGPAATNDDKNPTPTGPAPSASGAPTAGTGLFGAARAGFMAAVVPTAAAATTPETNPTAAAPAPPDTAAAAPSAAPSAAPTQVAAADPAPADSPPAAQPAAVPQPAAAQPQPAPVAAPQPAAVAMPTPPPTPMPTPVPVRSTPTNTGTTAAAGTAKGYLSVICIPKCDRVDLDGTTIGPSPVLRYSTNVGSHRIKLVSSNPPAQKTVSKIVVADTVNMVRESMP
jgi:serine/threonine-protein kinase